MQPSTIGMPKVDLNRRDNERHELYKLRDAAWASHASCKNTGTAEFLKLLLDIHKQIKVLDELDHPPLQAPPTKEKTHV